MKKIAILLIALIVISVGVLSGCTDNQIENELDKFIGTWIVEFPVYIENVSEVSVTWTFTLNHSTVFNSNTIYITNIYKGNVSEAVRGFKVNDENSTLCVTPLSGFSICYTYIFSNENTILTLKYLGNQFMKFNKVQ